MDKLLSDLAAALRERLSVIEDAQSRQDPVAHMTRLRCASEKIEAIEDQLPRQIDPQLLHFLQRRSYSKALEYLAVLQTRL
ncbi:MAG: hypothetical protein H0X73_07895 [Chthoniobacterales bacterium]|nr:hypothetical protein [Chthoniobacterales bacterium]